MSTMSNSKWDAPLPSAIATGAVRESMDLHQCQHAENHTSNMRTVPWQIPYRTTDNTLPASDLTVDLWCQSTERRPEGPVKTGRRPGRSSFFSPPISPTSQPVVGPSRPQNQREFSPKPTIRAAAAPVREEPGPQHDGSATYKLPAETYFRRYMSVSDVETLMQPPPSRLSLADVASLAFNPTSSPMAVSVPSVMSSVTSSGIADRQRGLFERLVRICTTAARTYWRSQFRSHLTAAVVDRRRTEHGRYRVTPYSRPANRPYHVLQRAHQRRAHAAEEAPRGLMDILVRIADGLWERAIASGSHAEELQAVHRMGNLYSWGDRVLGATRVTDFLSDENVYTVVMAARDLVSWLLCEEGKREIDELWEGRWGFGGFESGTVE